MKQFSCQLDQFWLSYVTLKWSKTFSNPGQDLFAVVLIDTTCQQQSTRMNGSPLCLSTLTRVPPEVCEEQQTKWASEYHRSALGSNPSMLPFCCRCCWWDLSTRSAITVKHKGDRVTFLLFDSALCSCGSEGFEPQNVNDQRDSAHKIYRLKMFQNLNVNINMISLSRFFIGEVIRSFKGVSPWWSEVTDEACNTWTANLQIGAMTRQIRFLVLNNKEFTIVPKEFLKFLEDASRIRSAHSSEDLADSLGDILHIPPYGAWSLTGSRLLLASCDMSRTPCNDCASDRTWDMLENRYYELAIGCMDTYAVWLPTVAP